MFKREFKYYKSRVTRPQWDKITDFNRIVNSDNKVKKKDPCSVNTLPVGPPYSLGLNEIENWDVFELTDKPGLIFISNPFTREGQQYWVERCLKDYTKKPNKLNLDNFSEINHNEDWWEVACIDDERGRHLIKKLRWATLGYHHNWDTKEYSESSRSEFPPDLAQLSSLIIEAVEGSSRDYQAQAAIVNFYHMDSTLSGHRDVSEPNSASPLISISFGQSAVFLLGGETLDDPVSALLIRSGDIVIMSGPARLCYHGVPRILPASETPWAGEEWEKTHYGRYQEASRININVRQVLLPGENLLNR